MVVAPPAPSRSRYSLWSEYIQGVLSERLQRECMDAFQTGIAPFRLVFVLPYVVTERLNRVLVIYDGSDRVFRRKIGLAKDAQNPLVALGIVPFEVAYQAGGPIPNWAWFDSKSTLLHEPLCNDMVIIHVSKIDSLVYSPDMVFCYNTDLTIEGSTRKFQLRD